MKKYAIIFAGLFILLSNIALAKMEYVEVKDQNGKVRRFSRLFMGTDHLEQGDWVQQGQLPPTREQIFAVLDEAVKNGINVIDTSPIYVGGIEHIIGEWLRSRRDAIKSDDFYVSKDLNPDREIYVLSKGGFPFDLFYSKELEPAQHSNDLIQVLKDRKILTDPNGQGPQPLQNVPSGTYASRLYGEPTVIKERVSEELGNTLNNLNGNLTVYLMHRDDFDSIDFQVIDEEKTPVANILKGLSSTGIADKFAILGVSNWTPKRVQEAVELGKNNPEMKYPLFNSPYFSLFEMSERSIHARGIQVKHNDMMDLDFLSGVMMNPYSPLGGFSILDKPAPAWENAKADAKKKYEAGDAYWRNVYLALFTTENEARYKRAMVFLQNYNNVNKTNCTLDQLLNAYALAHRRMNFLTVGPLSVEQVRRTITALDLSKNLRPQDLSYLYQGNIGGPPFDCEPQLAGLSKSVVFSSD